MANNTKVIGVGGIGLCVLPVLCRFVNFEDETFPEPVFTVVDGDQYEEKNRARQEFGECGPKATATVERLRDQFPRIEFREKSEFVDEANVGLIVREGDVVLLCVDNHKSRKIVSDRACQLRNVTVISGGNDRIDGNVLIHIRRDGVDLTPPLASHYHPEIVNPTDLHPHEHNQPGSCSRLAEEVPQLVIMNNLIAAKMLAAFYNVTDPVLYSEKVSKAPHRYAEVLCDLSTLTSVVRDRHVKRGA
jgi:molybdopterin/thiamine biosynthesis adenylyltransferase